MVFFNDDTIVLSEIHLLWGFGLFFTISLFCILYYFKYIWAFFSWFVWIGVVGLV